MQLIFEGFVPLESIYGKLQYLPQDAELEKIEFDCRGREFNDQLSDLLNCLSTVRIESERDDPIQEEWSDTEFDNSEMQIEMTVEKEDRAYDEDPKEKMIPSSTDFSDVE